MNDITRIFTDYPKRVMEQMAEWVAAGCPPVPRQPFKVEARYTPSHKQAFLHPSGQVEVTHWTRERIAKDERRFEYARRVG